MQSGKIAGSCVSYVVLKPTLTIEQFLSSTVSYLRLT